MLLPPEVLRLSSARFARAPEEGEQARLGARGDIGGQLPCVRQQALARHHAIHQAQLCEPSMSRHTLQLSSCMHGHDCSSASHEMRPPVCAVCLQSSKKVVDNIVAGTHITDANRLAWSKKSTDYTCCSHETQKSCAR